MNDSPSVLANGSGCCDCVPTNWASVTVSPVSMFCTSPSGVTARFSETTVESSEMFSLTVSGSVAFGLSGMLFDEFCASSTVAAKELGVSSIAISCMA